MIIRPQPGPQEMFASSPADIAFYGGSAGGGKSFGLLLEPTRFLDRKGFGGVIFRRTSPEITNEGGLWDTSEKIYSHIGGEPIIGDTYWRWPSGVTISFSHLQHEKDKIKWQGSAIPFIGFDEITHFSEGQFFYLVSRNRLTHDCKVKPWIRATCNPDPDSWVARFISWWIDEKTGFPIPERAGKLRWFVREGNEILWANKPETLLGLTKKEGVLPKSVTFIPSKLSDNPALMRQDPTYLSNLHALPLVDRARLLDGNWFIRAVQGMIFKRLWFGRPITLADMPKDKNGKPIRSKTLRYWDRAATEVTSATSDPDWTVGCKMTKIAADYFVLDIARMRGTPNAVLKFMKDTAAKDGRECEQVWEEDPGAAGKSEIAMLYREFSGYHCSAVRVTKAKIIRAKPASSQVEAGNVKILRGEWNEPFLNELEAFADWDEVDSPPVVKPHDDQVDAFSGAFTALANGGILGRGNF